MSIRKLRAGRVPNVTANNWVGEYGTLFYDEATGQFKIADGHTPGGHYVNLVIATPTVAGAIKAGPGANISNDGTLTIDTAGLPLSFGDFSAVGGNLSVVNANENMNLITNGNGGINMVGNISIYATSTYPSNPVFKINKDGQTKIYVTDIDIANGAVEIIGTTSTLTYPPINSGVMLHITGQNGLPSRLYNDGVGGAATFVGRRINNLITSPQAVNAGDDIIRISSTGYNGTTVPGSGSARITYYATENWTPSNFGGNIAFSVTNNGSTTLTEVANVSYSNGVSAIQFTTSGNVNAGNVNATNGTFTNINNSLAAINANNIAANSAISTINANVGAYEIWANANLTTQTQNFNTLNANVGAYEIWANANVGSIASNVNTLFTNTAIQQSQITSLASGANANTASFLTTYTGNITANNITLTNNINATYSSIGNIVLGNNTVYGALPNQDINFGLLTATANININRTTVFKKENYFVGNVHLYDTNIIASGFNKTGGTVTANGMTGQLTTNADSLAKGASGTFTVNNTYASPKDVIIVNIASGGTTNSYSIAVTAVNTNSFQVTITNNFGGALAEALTINYAVIKVS